MALHFRGIVTGPPADLKGNSRFTSSIQLWVKQRNAVIRDDWDRLEELADQGLGDAYASYRVLMRTLGVFDALNREATATLAALLKFHASQRETRKEFFSELKKQLVNSRANLPPEDRAALDALGEGNIADNLMLERLAKPRDVEDSETVDRAINSTVALLNRSLLALFYANYNRRYKELASHSFENHGDRLVDDFRQVVDQFEETLDAYAKRLHKALHDSTSFQSVAEQLAARIEDTAPEFGRMQAALNLYIGGLKNEGSSDRLLETLGRLAVRASASSRSAFALHAAAYYLCLQSKAVKQDPKARKMLEGSDRPYEAPFPNGKDTRLEDVQGVADGSFVEVRGFVSALTAKRDPDRKLLSVLTLTDPSASVAVDAVGIFVHLRNAGLLEGAYCQCSGTWRKQSSLNSGNPAVEIQQLRINELAEGSWKVQLHDLADRFIDWWPGGSNIAYGVSPHVSGGPEGRSKQLGAGELIFRQFYRD